MVRKITPQSTSDYPKRARLDVGDSAFLPQSMGGEDFSLGRVLSGLGRCELGVAG